MDTCITAFRTISTFSSMTTIAFGIWAKEVIEALQADVNQSVKVLRQEERFARLMVTVGDLPLRIEMVNDVPAHIGEIITHNVLGRLDSAENILDNKVTGAIDRNEPKDLADIWGLCCKMSLPLKPAIHDASSKAAGIFPADLARVLCSAKAEDWQVVQWIDPPPVFIAPNAKLMSASVNTSGSTFEAASPAALFQTRIVTGGLAALQTQYAVSRDGRFLINTQVDESNTTPITLILNWKPKP